MECLAAQINVDCRVKVMSHSVQIGQTEAVQGIEDLLVNQNIRVLEHLDAEVDQEFHPAVLQ